MNRPTLILAAHGSRHDPAVNQFVCELAQHIARLELFDEVLPAFHQGEPGFDTVLDSARGDRFVVVPLMTSDGYYCSVVLPRELRKNRRYKENIRITDPVGTHHDLIAIVLERVQSLMREHELDAQQTALVLVGHGTPRHPLSRLATENLAKYVARESCVAQVQAVFLDEAPGVEEALSLVSNQNVVVIPFLIGEGHHASRDVPARLGLAAGTNKSEPAVGIVGHRRVFCDVAIGRQPALREVIVKLAAIHSPLVRTPVKALKLGTRASRLARWQAEFVAARMRYHGLNVEIVALSTSGDRDLQTSIKDLPTNNPFGDDLERALLAGEIDMAVHSLKDLPVVSPQTLHIAAVLPRGPIGESLVSRGRERLSDLPAGAVVGTSSPRRAAQLYAVRPDIVARPIRGAVDDRVRQVAAGHYDAAIMATAGLQRLELMHFAGEELSLEHFLPAPAQGAIAVQVSTGSEHADCLRGVLDDAATHLATDTERAFLKPFEFSKDVAVAAYATVHEQIYLHARLLWLDGARTRDVSACGANPPEVVQRAIDALDQRSLSLMEAVA